MIHLSRISVALLIAVVLTGCITGRSRFYADTQPANPLPAEFIMVGGSNNGISAWRVTLEGGVYVWRHGDETIRSRLYPLKAKGIRDDFYVVSLDDPDHGEIYGLAEVSGRNIVYYIGAASELARSEGVVTGDTRFTTEFATRDDMETVFAALARKTPKDPSQPLLIEGVTIKVGRFTTYDPNVPAEHAQGLQLLSTYGAN